MAPGQLKPMGSMMGARTEASVAKRILVVEDDPAMLKLEAGILTREGFVVDRASSGEEALDRLQATAYQAIVLDLGLPGIDGFEVVRRLKEQEGPNRRVPIVIVTATGDHEAAHRGFDAGAVMFLTKPFGARALRAAIQSVIE